MFKYIKFWYHHCYLLQICHFGIFWMMLEEQAYVLERVFRIHEFQLLCDHQALTCTPKDPPRRVCMQERSYRNIFRTFIELSIKPFENVLLRQLFVCWNNIIICSIASGNQKSIPPPTTSDKLCPCPSRIQEGGGIIAECGVGFFLYTFW